MKNLKELLIKRGAEKFCTDWRIGAIQIMSGIYTTGKDKKEKAKLIVTELNELMEAVMEDRIIIKPK